MSDPKLTLEAIAKIKSCADGNGIDPSKIELLGTEERTLTLEAHMNLKLEMVQEPVSYPGGFKNSKNLPKARCEKVANDKDMQEKIKELKTKAETGNIWSRDAERQLKAEAGQGWGLEQADVTLDSLMQCYYSDAACMACNGSASINCSACNAHGYVSCHFCHETGFETCTQCNGSGLNPSDPNQYCTYCNGNRQIYCRDCQGKRQVMCVQCRGQARIKCNTCNGQGSFTTETNITPTAKAEFIMQNTGDLPGGFRKAIARGGTKVLAKGHASITAKELVIPESGAPYIPYEAVMPYAEIRVRINGKPMKCAVLGHKCVIIDLPNFIDQAIEAPLAELEQQVNSPSALEKALKFRVCREAFELLQNKQADGKTLRQNYAAGLSPEMAQRSMNLMRKIAYGQTMLTRIIVAVVLVALCAGLDYILLNSGMRMAAAEKTKPIVALLVDLAVCGMQFGLIELALRFAVAKKLQRYTNNSENILSHSAGSAGIIAGCIATLLYGVMVVLLKSAPAWTLIVSRPFG